MCADHSKELIFSLSYKIDFFENKLVKNGTWLYRTHAIHFQLDISILTNENKNYSCKVSFAEEFI